MKTDNRMAKAVGLLVLSLLFAGIFMAAQRRGEFQAQAYPFGVWIQSEGLCTLSTDDQITDAAISEQDLHASSISSFLRHSMSLRIYENRDCVESVMAVLFKIAVIPCVIFLIFHFALIVDAYLKRVICGFLHWQDGKKRQALLSIV